MVSRRTFLGASASGTLAAVAGCIDSLPLVGSSGGGPGSIDAATSSFLADPSLAPTVEPVPRADGVTVDVEAYDASIADHSEELASEANDVELSSYGSWIVARNEESAAALDSVDYTTSTRYRTAWVNEDSESLANRTGVASGTVGYLRAEYDRDALLSALEISGTPDRTVEGFDLYGGDDGPGFGFGNHGVLVGFLTTLHVPTAEVGDAARQRGTMRLLERGSSRSTSTESPPEWVQIAVDAASPAHNLFASHRDHASGDEESAEVWSFHVEGDTTTVTIAESAPDAASFPGSEWTSGSKRTDVLSPVGILADRSRGDRETLRAMLLEEPTVEVGERHGVASAKIPSEEVRNPVLI